MNNFNLIAEKLKELMQVLNITVGNISLKQIKMVQMKKNLINQKLYKGPNRVMRPLNAYLSKHLVYYLELSLNGLVLIIILTLWICISAINNFNTIQVFLYICGIVCQFVVKIVFGRIFISQTSVVVLRCLVSSLSTVITTVLLEETVTRSYFL